MIGILNVFRRDERGNFAITFALAGVMMFGAMGVGLDLARAYLVRQKMSHVATLACQYAGRSTAADASVSSFIGTTASSQNVSLTQTSFSTAPTGASTVSLAASVPTSFVQILGFQGPMALSVQMNCFYAGAAASPPDNSQILIKESFEALPDGANKSWLAYLPNGQIGTQAIPRTYNSAVGYTGSNGTQWHIMGYCLEQDIAGQIEANAYDGNYSVELDCDNGSGSAGNSSISTLIYLAAGSYELRYAYASRVDYPSYDPTYLCGSAASDLDWADSTSTSWSGSMTSAYRTNQINVYLDLNISGGPPTHSTLVGQEYLAGSNLIDMCLYGQSWIQRSVQINVVTPGYYWLSFAADGSNDSYGGQLDDILLCNVSCPSAVQDNFTTAWSASNLLFEDNFESPPYTGTDSTKSYNNNGNVNGSVGASSFWNLSSNGWSNAPTNQLPYWVTGCPQARQCVQLGWNSNSLISQPFLLVPGYYQIKYNYVSEVLFATLGSSVSCGSTPTAAGISTLTAGSGAGTNRVLNTRLGTLNYDTNMVGVFMSHAEEASTPNSPNALGTVTTFTNPDNPNGPPSTTPTVPPNAISLTSYNASQVNPLLDICGYAAAPQTRTSVVFIPKSAFYWLTLAALGTSDAYGGQIDDVRITALGSPYMSNPPAGAITIPVPAPQPSTSLYFNGFSISADPLAP